MKGHSLAYGRQKGGSTLRTLIPVWTLPLRHISSSLGVARPFTNKIEKGWKKCTDPTVGGARSITLYDACIPSSEFGCRSSTSFLEICRSPWKQIMGSKLTFQEPPAN